MSSTEKLSVSKHKLKAQISLHSMMIPGLIFAIIFMIVPLFGIIIAFQDFSESAGIFGSPIANPIFINFYDIFKQGYFMIALRNTVVIALVKIIALTISSIILALLINEIQSPILKKIIQTTIFLPYFLSWILLGDMFVEMFGQYGVFNLVLETFGIKEWAIETFGVLNGIWIADMEAFFVIIILTDVWKNVGYQVVVFLAAITTINSNLYEAAEIDGAGHLQKCWHITIPGIKPMIILMSILNIGNIMNAGFEQILTMYSTNVSDISEILDTLIYKISLGSGVMQYEQATAMGIFKSLISCICFLVAYRIAFKVSDYKLF